MPDAKTVWLYRDALAQAGKVEELFGLFDHCPLLGHVNMPFQATDRRCLHPLPGRRLRHAKGVLSARRNLPRGADRGHLARQGYIARGGQILDGEPLERHWSERQWRTIVPVPRNHNTREENVTIKKGEVPEDWADKPAKRCQKDLDARWREEDQKTVRGTVFPTSKHGKSHYGYKNHVNVDRMHKLVRRYHVSPSRDIAAQCPVPLPGSTCEACVRGGNGRRRARQPSGGSTADAG